MSVKQRGSSFVVSVGSGANRFRATCTTRDEAERAELQELLRRKAAPSHGKGAADKATPEVVSKTLQEAFERTFRLHWKGEKAEKTHSINAGAVLKALGGETVVSDITADDITEMVDEFEDQGNSGSTVNKKISCLSMMLKTAKAQWPGCLGTLPAMSRRKENKHRVRWMDGKEEGIALDMCHALGLYDLKDYIVVAVDTGFRRNELLPFQSKDYMNGLLVLHDGETKSDKARSIPATARVHEILQRRGNLKHPFEGLTIHKLRWQWDQLKTHMGLEDDPQFIVHMLRHTCASRMVQRGVPLAVVQKWMGHASITTTMRYAHLAPSSLMQGKEALEQIEVEAPAFLPPPPILPEGELHDF